MKQKIPELDGLRAIAILAVLVTHFSHQQVLIGGYLRVDLFFVLSRFLITSLLISEEPAGGLALGNFYAILAVVVTRVMLLSMKIGIYEQSYARADSLLVGCGAALLFATRPPKLAKWVAPATLATVLATFAFMPWRSFLMMSFGFTILA